VDVVNGELGFEDLSLEVTWEKDRDLVAEGVAVV